MPSVIGRFRALRCRDAPGRRSVTKASALRKANDISSAETGPSTHPRRCSLRSTARSTALTVAANTVIMKVTDMMMSTLCRPMAFISM
jgi:hypothetical protein